VPLFLRTFFENVLKSAISSRKNVLCEFNQFSTIIIFSIKYSIIELLAMLFTFINYKNKFLILDLFLNQVFHISVKFKDCYKKHKHLRRE
jgi:hypothetical protein